MSPTLAPKRRRHLVERPVPMAAVSLVAPWAALKLRDEPVRACGAAFADLGLAAAAGAAVWRGKQLAGDPWQLVVALAAAVVVAAVARALTCWGSVADAGWFSSHAGYQVRLWPARVLAAVATLATGALVTGAAAGAWTYVQLDQVFADHDVQAALPEAPPSTAGLSDTTTTWTPSSGSGRINVLLVGTDEGKGRVGARTDSMNLVSVDAATGDAWMVGIPRNLQRAPMPRSTGGLFPRGFDDGSQGLLNAVWGWAEAHPQYAPDPSDAGPSMLKAVVANLTGQKVDYLVTVRMQGLDQVVDAIGGVDVENLRAAPLTPLVDDPRPIPKVLAVGVHHMEGPLAVAYSRSRHADSDYERMARQRCVLEGVLKKVRTPSVMGRYPLLVRQLAGWVRTDAPRSATDRLASAFSRVDPSKVRVLSLVPPTVDVRRPDVVRIREMVAALDAAGRTPAPGAAPAGPGVVGAGQGSVTTSDGVQLRQGENSASVGPAPTTSSTAVPGGASPTTVPPGAMPAGAVTQGAASKVCRTP